jgi:V/A-type H+-transporting ATPase subunit F
VGYFVIGDDETVTGFRLAGVEGRAARTPPETREALKVAAATEGVSIIVITERLAAEVKPELRGYYATGSPLIIHIPDRGGPSAERKSIREMIKVAVGVSM